MATNERYKNNVVFTEDAVQNLLTNIKNYPITDVEFVTKNEKTSTSAPNTIWHSDNNDKPCIRVTYGNENNLEGNLSKLSAENR